ncbi:TPA: alpha/beta fold hydrolase [Bacillus cereus]|nr:alpha/beta fold hydrolase [Bacillus cereus]HDR4609477.1 alpha/beta fold hydrolase [Bacillus cereus]HDR4626631.1 alpha/beta fold hydrolase [Bacillus cereus]HDR4661553.1 alpha/beta fold hydrolase [Bacillus cereus]HDR4928330.1 alpha/beta fold hydrolase [Bacillus cereus]
MRVNGNNLFVKVLGQGEPIVFLHGGPGSEHRFFLPYMTPLAEKFQLVFYDQTGCGESEKAEDSQYSMQNEVENLEALRVQLGFEKINILGESWGSMLALLYATTYPERVNKLLLTAAIGVNVTGLERFGEELQKRLTKEDKVVISEINEKIKIGEASIYDMLQVLDPYYVFTMETLTYKQKTTFSNEVNTTIGADMVKNYDVTKHVEKLSKIPILIAQGSHDILTLAIIKEHFTEYIPHIEFLEIANCGHWTVVEQPEKMCNIAYSFFKN